MNDLEMNSQIPKRYYEELGRGHDYLLRCKDCQSLETYASVSKIGCCSKCGNKRFIEITILSEQEMADIVSGVIDFPDRDKFLEEFSPVGDAA